MDQQNLVIENLAVAKATPNTNTGNCNCHSLTNIKEKIMKNIHWYLLAAVGAYFLYKKFIKK